MNINYFTYLFDTKFANKIQFIKMMSLMRKRAEAARRKRIDHVFMKADDNSSGKITVNQMIKCYSLNGEVIKCIYY